MNNDIEKTPESSSEDNEIVFETVDERGEEIVTDENAQLTDENAQFIGDKAESGTVDELNKGAEEGEEESPTKKQRVSAILKSVIRCLVLGITIVAFFFAGYLTSYLSYDKDLRSMYFVYKTYKNHYYFQDEDKTAAKVLTEGLMDIYSEYYTPDEYKAEKNESNGERKGYGISFDGLKIYRVCGNSPAEKSGLKKGGNVVGYAINDGSRTEVSKLDDLSTALSKASDKDKLTLYVDYNGSISEHSMYKSDYRENYVFYTDSTGSYRFTDDSGSMILERFGDNDLTLGEGWGYIKYVSFYGLEKSNYGSVQQFVTALDKMFANGKTKLIIDLRNNGGGYMSIMCAMSGVLCPQITEGTAKTRRVAQTVEYKGGSKNYYNITDTYAKNSQNEYYVDKLEKIVFLANSGSASASEALIGAVLDYDSKSGNNKVTVVLEPSTDKNGNTVYRTYGKGIMQTTFENKINGEALKLTTAKIFWPLSNISIHGVGITTETDSRVSQAVGDPVIFAQGT